MPKNIQNVEASKNLKPKVTFYFWIQDFLQLYDHFCTFNQVDLNF